MKNAAPIILILEPLQERGMRVRVLVAQKFAFEEKLEHGTDLVATVARIKQKFSAVLVRSHVGSFSASRGALVAANVLAATRGATIHFTESEVETPEQISTALQRGVKFSYERDAHITTKA